jgi:hypothetical protein
MTTVAGAERAQRARDASAPTQGANVYFDDTFSSLTIIM